MKKNLLSAFVVLQSIFSIGQEVLPFTPIQTIDPNENFNDLELIDSIFENRRIVGVGESTHGTSEFTTFRHRLFKYLVVKKGFTVFFLEADASACQRVNRYINGFEDNVKDALLEIKLWPWLTEELLTLVEWMRTYNETAEKKIQFVGCDMQLILDDQLELSRLFLDSNHVEDVFSELKFPYDDTLFVKSSYDKWHSLDSIRLNRKRGTDSLQYSLIDISIEQWYQFKLTKGIKHNFRDSCMAANMLHYLHLFPNSKGMYFAHNGHVAKAIYDYENRFPRKVAGYYLSESLGLEYLCIGQTTETGTFNALTYGNQGYEFTVNTLKRPKNNTLEKYLKGFNQSILICSLEELKSKHNLSYTEIGALYGKSAQGYQVKRYKSFISTRYDYFIFIKNTTESDLLKKPNTDKQNE